MDRASRIYLDNAATTPIDPRVIDTMKPFLEDAFGNPSSLHCEGREAHRAVEGARRNVASLVGAKPEEVIFTSSGTEADNLIIQGICRPFSAISAHIITSSIEHPAVLETCKLLESYGAAVTYLPVCSDGIVDPASLLKYITPRTKLISIMAANNVTGAIQPIRDIARISRDKHILFHTDAVQSVGKIPMDMDRDLIDAVSLSSHKIHGPKGVGALVIRNGIKINPLIYGGGQESRRRSSTENVAGIVGFGKAAEIAMSEMKEESMRLARLRECMVVEIKRRIPICYLIGDQHKRLPGHLCLGFEGLEGEMIKMLLAIDDAGFAVSTGSACSAHKASEPSYVLTAMGMDPLRARGSLRVTLGRFNTAEEATHFVNMLAKIVPTMRPIFTHA